MFQMNMNEWEKFAMMKINGSHCDGVFFCICVCCFCYVQLYLEPYQPLSFCGIIVCLCLNEIDRHINRMLTNCSIFTVVVYAKWKPHTRTHRIQQCTNTRMNGNQYFVNNTLRLCIDECVSFYQSDKLQINRYIGNDMVYRIQLAPSSIYEL